MKVSSGRLKLCFVMADGGSAGQWFNWQQVQIEYVLHARASTPF
jgi:hypothetical protein